MIAKRLWFMHNKGVLGVFFMGHLYKPTRSLLLVTRRFSMFSSVFFFFFRSRESSIDTA